MLKIFFPLFLLCSCSLFGQQELGTHFMRDVWQSGLTNPAFSTDKKISIGLPGLYVDYFSSEADFVDLIQVSADGKTVFNEAEILAALGDDNFLDAFVQIPTVHFSFGVKKLRFSFHHAVNFDAHFGYPKTLAEFLFNGNGGSVGQTMALGPDISLTGYNEFGLGVSGKVGKLGLGGRVKFLTGIGNASTSTEKNKIDLFTDEDIYQLTLTTDYLLNTSSYLQINDLSNFEINLGVSDFSGNDILSSNNGFALDLGVTYDVSDRLQLAASIVDLGVITWDENVTTYTSNDVINYDGIQIDDVLQSDSISLSSALDSLDEVFDFQESAEQYQTKLTSKAYISANYKLNDRWTFGGLIHARTRGGNTNWSYAISARAALGKILGVGVTYAGRNDRFDNLGLNASLHLGPVQLFAMTDNIIGFVQSKNSNNYNGRIGLNIAF